MLSTLQRIEANPETDNESKESDDEESIPKQSMSLEAMQKLNDMRVNNLLCDASIKLGDGTVFNVHRAILSACSDYFKTCFTTTLNDVPRTETLVVGVSSKEMEIVIKYAYLRDLSDIDKTNVVEIMIVSDYFGMLGLMKFCINFIINMLSSQNCIIFWLMSRQVANQFIYFEIPVKLNLSFLQIPQHSKIDGKITLLYSSELSKHRRGEQNVFRAE